MHSVKDKHDRAARKIADLKQRIEELHTERLENTKIMEEVFFVFHLCQRNTMNTKNN